MTSPLRDEPQQWVRDEPVAWRYAVRKGGMWTLTTDANLIKSIEPGSDEVVEPLYTRAAPKDSKHIERAMELALDCESWRLARLTGTTQDHRNYTTKKLDEARAALRRHLEGGGSE